MSRLQGKKVGSRRALKDAAKKSEGKWVKGIPEDGLTVRFLEEPEEWISYVRYYDEDSKNYVPMLDDERAPKGARVQTRFVANALDIEADRVIPLDIPKSLISTITKYLEKYDTICDRDYDLGREGSGLDTDYTIIPDSKAPRNVKKYELIDLESFLVELHDAALAAPVSDEDDDDDTPAKKPTRGTAKKAAAKKPEPEDDGPDLDALGESADEGDTDAIETLTGLAEDLDLDPDEYGTWVELAEAISEGLDDEGDDESDEDADEDEDEEDSDSEDEVAELDEATLKAMTIAELKEWGEYYELDPLPTTKAKLVPAILAAQAEANGESEDDGEEEELDEDALGAMSLKELRSIADDFEIDHAGLKKDALVEAILEAASE